MPTAERLVDEAWQQANEFAPLNSSSIAKTGGVKREVKERRTVADVISYS